ncbi:nuclear transport factor 2 family protein [Sphingobium sp. AS12]|uniref:nuclear transport factor 2 family protein n=1 Tax=Sphingobium sp. AS12 TaxID=2849495 RepID=UPI001C31D1F3|nr:nuclear transport factor 2 family protein [Sphingobium sp. AS12]MBV2149806.1 nuclear transport factor 2 family protein [Sphingobium sp. AS12]
MSEIRRLASVCLHRYFALCDRPRRVGQTSYGDLFSANAIWEGVGGRYAERFGRFEGRDAIAGAMRLALDETPSYRFNLHLLTNELWMPGSALTGAWLLQQFSVLNDERAIEATAEIRVTFDVAGGAVTIARFRTRNLMWREAVDGIGENADLAGLEELS